MYGRLLSLLLVLVAAGPPLAVAGAPRQEAPPDGAERALAGVSAAFRDGNAAGVVAWMATGEDSRLRLSLPGVASGSYTGAQAEAVLADPYFAARRLLAVIALEGTTTGGGSAFVRSYRVRVRSRGRDLEGTLTVSVERGRKGWSLSDLAGDV